LIELNNEINEKLTILVREKFGDYKKSIEEKNKNIEDEKDELLKEHEVTKD